MPLGPGSHSVSQPPWQLGDVMWFCSASCGRKGWIQFLPTSWMGQQLTFCSPLSSFLWQRAEETQTAGMGRLSQLPSEEEPRIEQQGKENLGPCCPQRAESPSTRDDSPCRHNCRRNRTCHVWTTVFGGSLCYSSLTYTLFYTCTQSSSHHYSTEERSINDFENK